MVMVELDEEKRALRTRARKMRLVADQKEGPIAAAAVVGHFLDGLAAFDLAAGAVVAGYWPIGTEIDDRPLLARLHERDFDCALPVVADRGAPLVFRRWAPLDPVEPGDHDTVQPPVTAPEVTPDLLLIPLLAFDAAGWRLGQGVGYYDRTLAALRRTKPVTAVGIAYAAQCFDAVPHGPLDQPLDWLLSERALTRAAP